jgi:hypothetical protein
MLTSVQMTDATSSMARFDHLRQTAEDEMLRARLDVFREGGGGADGGGEEVGEGFRCLKAGCGGGLVRGLDEEKVVDDGLEAEGEGLGEEARKVLRGDEVEFGDGKRFVTVLTLEIELNISGSAGKPKN